MKKTLICILSIILAVSALLVTLVGCDEPDPEVPKETFEMVVLGDSIAEAILGPQPLSERDNYSYCSVVGKSNGFVYHNRSVSGHTTTDLLNYITAPEDNAYTVRTLIQNADLISISILGNDYIHTGLTSKAVEYGRYGTFTEADRILSKSYENICAIVDELRKNNPKAVILFQTVYNPFHDENVIIEPEAQVNIKANLEARGIDEDMYAVSGKLLQRLNNVLYRYRDEHPGKIEILEVNAEFDRIHSQDPDRLKRLIYDDGIHPTSEGHAVIADVMQKKLVELGLVEASKSESVLNEVKKLRIDTLERLYATSGLALQETIDRLVAEKSFEGVTKVYFDAVEDYVPDNYDTVYRNVPGTWLMEEDTDYYITQLDLMDLSFYPYIDPEGSYIRLKANGEIQIRAQVSDRLLLLAAAALSSLDAAINVNDLGLQVYVGELFPGHTITDIARLLDAFYGSFGIRIDGLDLEEESIKAVVEHLKETGTILTDINIPDDLALVIEGRYFLKRVPSNTNPDGFVAACLGNSDTTTDPFLMLTFGTDFMGNESLTYTNHIVGLTISAASDIPIGE